MIETTRPARPHRYQQGYIRTPRIGKTNPCNGKCGNQLDEQLETVSLDSVEALEVPQKHRFRPMRLKGRREAHNAEVVERALFATRKSLKSLAAKQSFSPFSNIRAVTFKLCSRSRPTAIENHPASKLCPALNSR
jgi:hypothetical protein